MSTALVIGSGIVGLSAAWHLLRRGWQVVVVDQSAIGSGASYGNAGLVSIGHPPLTRPGLALQGIKWMLDPTSPLYIQPRASMALVRWLATFHRNCTRTHLHHCMDVLCDMGWPARDCFEELLAAEPIDCDYRRGGWLEVCLTKAGLERGRHEADAVRERGYHVELLERDALLAREPAFRPAVAGAHWYADSACCSPDAFMRGLARACVKRGAVLRAATGARGFLVEGNRQRGAVTEDGHQLEADAVVLAAGAWSTPIAAQLGVAIPMEPAKGYHEDLEGVAPAPTVGCVLAETFVAVTPMFGRLRLAGTLELSGLNDRMVQRRLGMLRRGAERFLIGLDRARRAAVWNGLRPCTPDGLPIAGLAPEFDNLYVATGRAMLGWTLGPLMGRLAAETLNGEAPRWDAAPLAPSRFARG